MSEDSNSKLLPNPRLAVQILDGESGVRTANLKLLGDLLILSLRSQAV